MKDVTKIGIYCTNISIIVVDLLEITLNMQYNRKDILMEIVLEIP
jgi:hypothetical protein